MEPLVRLDLPQGCGMLLLHSCCAPCSSAVLECLLQNGIRPVVFFSNSNIVPVAEYEIRKKELMGYASSLGVEVVDDDYDHSAWLESVRGLEDAPERGPRCLQCFKYRLCRAARYAAENGFDCLTTTLASSRWKDINQVDQAGRLACESTGGKVVWWGRDWRKGGLQPRRSELIRELGFYNQNYCGCEFSFRR